MSRMRADRRTMLVTAVGSLVVGGIAGGLVTALGVGAQADEPPLPPLATQAVAVDATTLADDALPQQIENRGYACPAFTFLAPDGDHTASARWWSVTLRRDPYPVGFSVTCQKVADVGTRDEIVDQRRRATSGPRLVHDPVVEVSAFGEAVRTDTRMSATTTQTEWIVERDGWVVFAGLLRPTDGADALVTTAQSMLATWHWGPPGS